MTIAIEDKRRTPGDGSAIGNAAPAARGERGDRTTTPFFSVVVPVRDGGAGFGRCLQSLRASTFDDFELIVVDDASSDGSAELAADQGARVVRLDRRLGPAAARNRGAAGALGQFLLFLDADCEVHSDTLTLAAEILEGDPGLDGVFGSYDDRPAASGLVSRFKNLHHHWMHQQARPRASTFWAGCGALRRERFLELGGFDERRYAEPSIEDIELGYRFTETGSRIVLSGRIQVRHAKRWSISSLVRTDLLRRGAPWAELLLERRGRGGELNLGGRQRLVVAAGVCAVTALALSPFAPAALVAAALLIAVVVVVERGFYALLARRCGALRAVAAVPLHLLYCVICAAAFALGATRVAVHRLRSAGSA
jgi:glycosyltransferase involved in cell wall biosynthesis